MAATYDIAEPTIRDVIRGLFFDTDLNAPILQDETYDARIARFGEREGAAKIGESIAAFWSQEVVSTQQGSEAYRFASDRHKQIMAQVESIRIYGVEGTSNAASTLRAGSPALPTPLTDGRLTLMT